MATLPERPSKLASVDLNALTAAFQDRSPGTLSQPAECWSFIRRGQPRASVTAET
jgi:hypothetical protein